MAVDPGREPPAHAFPQRRVEQVRPEHVHLRGEGTLAGHESPHRRAAPDELRARRERERRVLFRLERLHALADERAQGAVRRREQPARALARLAVGPEAEAFEDSGAQPLDQHLAVAADRGHELRGLVAGDHRSGPVDELLRQPLVQRVREPVLDGARPLLPVPCVGDPLHAVRQVGPGANRSDPSEQCVHLALAAVELADVRVQEVLGDACARPAQEAVDAREQPRVRLRQHTLEVGNLAHLPQQAHGGRVPGERHHLGVAHEGRERAGILGVAHAEQEGVWRLALEAAEQRQRREEVELVRAPEQLRERREAVRLDGLDEPLVERPELRRGCELPVTDVAAGAARDLADLRRRQRSRADAVELREAGEDHGVDVEVQPHADRVGGDEVVDLAALVQADLRVARARRERSEHERRAAALAAQPGGHLVQLAQREDDQCRARRQLRQPLGLGVRERRQPLARLERGVGDQLVQDRPDRLGADQPGLEGTARVQDPVREDVAALAVGRQLHLVDSQEVDLEVERHRLDRGDPVRRPPRHDPLLARDERDGLGPLERGHPVVVLARQQPQREADHSRGVRQHPLDGQVRLAGVRGTQEYRDGAVHGCPARMRPAHPFRNPTRDNGPTRSAPRDA